MLRKAAFGELGKARGLRSRGRGFRERVEVALASGRHEILVSDIGRTPIRRAVDIPENGTASEEIVLGFASRISFDVSDAKGQGMPRKVEFIGLGETPSPDLGPALRAHGCLHRHHSEKARFDVAVPPGRYRVVVIRGIEFSHVSREVSIDAGERVSFAAILERLADTSGWVSADYHNHSTESGDNTCGTRDRIINLAAEHIEFAPTTEHNRLFDWRPEIHEPLGSH